jgi:hypothetical protein
MARFPLSEADIVRLAHDVVRGLTKYPDDFPSPPEPPEHIQAAVDKYMAAHQEAFVAAAVAKEKTAAKEKAVEELVDVVKSDLRYAENHVRGDHAKLILLGWGGRRRKTAKGLPGQPRDLEVVKVLTGGAVILGWGAPASGGPVAAYRIQRRQVPGDFIDVGTSVDTQITLKGQEQGVEYEYLVIAVNKKGEGTPSNVARAVL